MLETKMHEYVVVVDENDNEKGAVEKLYAHQNAILHRAFSILIYRYSKGKIEFLLQKRDKNKYHSGGAWSNSCCSHPRPGEKILDAANRRLYEEMGFNNDLRYVTKILYKESVGDDIYEYELDHLFVGEYSGQSININKNEVEDYCWLSKTAIEEELKSNKDKFSAWFELVFKAIITNTEI